MKKTSGIVEELYQVKTARVKPVRLAQMLYVVYWMALLSACCHKPKDIAAQMPKFERELEYKVDKAAGMYLAAAVRFDMLVWLRYQIRRGCKITPETGGSKAGRGSLLSSTATIIALIERKREKQLRIINRVVLLLNSVVRNECNSKMCKLLKCKAHYYSGLALYILRKYHQAADRFRLARNDRSCSYYQSALLSSEIASLQEQLERRSLLPSYILLRRSLMKCRNVPKILKRYHRLVAKYARLENDTNSRRMQLAVGIQLYMFCWYREARHALWLLTELAPQSEYSYTAAEVIMYSYTEGKSVNYEQLKLGCRKVHNAMCMVVDTKNRHRQKDICELARKCIRQRSTDKKR